GAGDRCGAGRRLESDRRHDRSVRSADVGRHGRPGGAAVTPRGGLDAQPHLRCPTQSSGRPMSKAVTDAREGSLPRRLLLLSALAASFGLAADRSARAAEQTFVLRIENGRVAADMRTIRVQQGDVIKLMWSADRRSVVHLHGYDIEKTVEPG